MLEHWPATLFEFFSSGGLVMIPLIIVSVWMWTLICFKTRELYGLASRERSLDRLDGSVVDSNDRRNWQLSILRDIGERWSGTYGLDSKLLHSLSHKWLERANRHLDTIMVLAGIAPMLGIIGTITGMIATFGVISISGTGNVGALSTGISEALVTTQTGLAVSIPGLVMGSFLRRRAKRMCARIDRFCINVGQCKVFLQGDQSAKAGGP